MAQHSSSFVLVFSNWICLVPIGRWPPTANRKRNGRQRKWVKWQSTVNNLTELSSSLDVLCVFTAFVNNSLVLHTHLTRIISYHSTRNLTSCALHWIGCRGHWLIFDFISHAYFGKWILLTNLTRLIWPRRTIKLHFNEYFEIKSLELKTQSE